MQANKNLDIQHLDALQARTLVNSVCSCHIWELPYAPASVQHHSRSIVVRDVDDVSLQCRGFGKKIMTLGGQHPADSTTEFLPNPTDEESDVDKVACMCLA